MKRFNVFLGALLTAVIIAACAPAFEPGLETNYTRQKENTDARYFTVGAAGTLQVQPVDGGTKQIITITTYAHRKDGTAYSSTDDVGYNLVINEAGQIDGVGVYPVKSPNTVGDPHVHETASLLYTAVYKGRDTVELLLPLSGTAVTAKAVLIVDPARAKFNGDGQLNMDGDTNLGEPDEDVFMEYFSVSDNTSASITLTAITGVEWTPPVSSFTNVTSPALTTISASGVPSAPASGGINVEGGTKLVISGFAATNTAPDKKKENLVAASEIAKAVKFQRFNHTSKKWEDYAFSAEWDTTGATADLTITFSEGARLFEFYRYQVDYYQIAEKEKVNGFIHRLSYDQSFGYGNITGTRTPGAWEDVGIVTRTDRSTPAKTYILPNTGAFNVAPFGIPGEYYIDVTAPASLTGTNTDVNLVDSTLTAANVKMYYYNGAVGAIGAPGVTGGTTSYGEVDLSNASFQKLAPNKFRIVLPPSFVRITNSGDTARFQIRLHDVQVNYSTGVDPNKVPYTNVKIFNEAEADGAFSINSGANFAQ